MEPIQNSPAATPAASNQLLAGAALAGGALLFATAKKARAQSSPIPFSDEIFGTGDVKVLNYALALEALEADLYVQALQRLTGGGTNALGTQIPGLGLADSNAGVRYVRDFGAIEAAHRDFFIGALGANAITAAGKPLNTAKFDFDIETKSEQDVLNLLQTVEAAGVRAYIGAIPSFVTTTYLQTAAAIQGTEARHTAVITAIINQRFGSTQSVAPLAGENNGIDQPLAPQAILDTVSPLIVL
ncbi:MAG TPA: ferritin-like domain-containing protein [Abditibacterium sp.]|jgi:hypothetical protein